VFRICLFTSAPFQTDSLGRAFLRCSFRHHGKFAPVCRRTPDRRQTPTSRGDLIHTTVRGRVTWRFAGLVPPIRPRTDSIRVDRYQGVHVVDRIARLPISRATAQSEHLDGSLRDPRMGTSQARERSRQGRNDHADATPPLWSARLRRDVNALDVDGITRPSLPAVRSSIRFGVAVRRCSPSNPVDRSGEGSCRMLLLLHRVGIGGVRMNCDRLSAGVQSLDDRRGASAPFV